MYFENGLQTANSEIQENLYYANADVSITGTYSYDDHGTARTETYSVNLKKGWNYVYKTDVEGDGNREYTSTKPSDTLKWNVADECDM